MTPVWSRRGCTLVLAILGGALGYRATGAIGIAVVGAVIGVVIAGVYRQKVMGGIPIGPKFQESLDHQLTIESVVRSQKPKDGYPGITSNFLAKECGVDERNEGFQAALRRLIAQGVIVHMDGPNGSECYAPTRLQWAAIELQALYGNTSPTHEYPIRITFIPWSDGVTVKCLIHYPVDLPTAVMKRRNATRSRPSSRRTWKLRAGHR